MSNFRLYSASFVSFYKMYCRALTLPCSMCRWGRGKEQPGPCALWVDPEGPQLCGGPRFARGSQPEEALRVWHQDTDEDLGAEPPHPVHSKKVSVQSESMLFIILPYAAVWDYRLLFEHQIMNPAASHLITLKMGKKKEVWLFSSLSNALQRYNWKPITVLGCL